MSDILPRLTRALEGRYDIEGELGRGGTSTVFLAKDLRHGRHVALKVVQRDLMGTVGQDRFRQEIRIAASLQHPNILPLLDSGEIDGRPFFVTPHVEGSSLRELLDRKGTLPSEQVGAIVTEVAEGLSYAHGRGIVHRDVKPGNILLSDGHAILTDFGLSRVVGSDAAERLTEAGTGPGGTLRYMSPEQLQGDMEPDGRTDVYSLACVAYEMLCGEPPFAGRTAWSVMARHLSGSAESVRVVRPDLPPDADAVLAKALHKDPSQRFSTPRDFATALRGSLGPEGARSRGRRWRVGRGVTVTAALVLALVVVRFFLPGSDEPPLDPESVVVFPLLDARGPERVEGEGEQAAIMIGAALDHAGPLRWIDGWDWLDPAMRGDMNGWTIQQGVAIARDRNAGFVIDGRIMSQGDSLLVVLRLHEVAQERLVHRSLAGDLRPEARIADLGTRAVAELLPSLVDSDVEVPTDLLSRFVPAAVAAWLQGEEAYRRADFSTALELFQQAVQEDSTMALAAMRGGQAASWSLRPQLAAQLLDVGLAHGEVLAPKQRALAEGLVHYYAGRAQPAVDRIMEALSADPTWSDAWMSLGEVYYHLLPEGASNDDYARSAFRSALDLDPGFTPPLVHLSELAFRHNDVAEAERFAGMIPSDGSGRVAAALHLAMMSDCARGGAGEVDWRAEVEASPLAVLGAALYSAVGGTYPDCAIAGFSALREFGPPNYGWSAFLGLRGVYLATGRFEDARDLTAGALQFDRQRKYLLVADALAGLPAESDVDDVVRELEEGGDVTPTLLWATGAWHASRGRPDRAGRLRDEASRLAALEGATATDTLLVDVLDAWVALASGDTAVALRRFEALTPTATAGGLAAGIWEPLGVENLQLARLRLAAGQPADAFLAAEALDHPQPVVFLGFLPESLRIRAAAAEALGQDTRAAEYRSRLQRLTESGS